MASTQPWSIHKVATLPDTLVAGGIYFETSTGLLYLATSASAKTCVSGVRTAALAGSTLTITKFDGTNVTVDIATLAQSALQNSLNSKLNIGTEEDTPTVKSYHGVMKRIDGLNPESIVHFAPSVGKPEVPEGTLDNILLKTAQALTPEEQGQVKKNLGLDNAVYYESLGEVSDIDLQTSKDE